MKCIVRLVCISFILIVISKLGFSYTYSENWEGKKYFRCIRNATSLSRLTDSLTGTKFGQVVHQWSAQQQQRACVGQDFFQYGCCCKGVWNPEAQTHRTYSTQHQRRSISQHNLSWSLSKYVQVTLIYMKLLRDFAFTRMETWKLQAIA